MVKADPNEIQRKLFKWLQTTRYASTALDFVSANSSNFVFRAHLSDPLEDGTAVVIIKHDSNPPKSTENPEPLSSTVEKDCFRALQSFRTVCEQETFKCTVETPQYFYFDDETKTHILECLPNGINLKNYALQNLLPPSTDAARPQFYCLGKCLAEYITAFHRFAMEENQKPLYETLKQHQAMQDLKHMINYDWLLQRIEQWPHILEEARGIFQEVKTEALKELEGKSTSLVPIHGDFWTGNILLPNTPVQGVNELSVLVIDWEMAHLGVPAMDHGEIIGELYALWLYRRIDAGLWMIQGYADGLGEQTESSAWRIALQVGSHLLSFGTIAPGWGTPEQVEEVALRGRDIVVHSWKKDRRWLENTELACLLPRSTS
ncbi:uncharacterized protein N7459_005837 [Penicillium hispanicum]|uniref:uncharacterized protein n=1 Tax=Penicillium hispanicum TaxID=1080232 RepID=UPI002540C96C|nr:uncharacterized protein N7459_005837 [Penicillium hispanicum]KAJ5579852.1 hypothetical protein N7459_005837 [Penicillium hispanicum]